MINSLKTLFIAYRNNNITNELREFITNGRNMNYKLQDGNNCGDPSEALHSILEYDNDLKDIFTTECETLDIQPNTNQIQKRERTELYYIPVSCFEYNPAVINTESLQRNVMQNTEYNSDRNLCFYRFVINRPQILVLDCVGTRNKRVFINSSIELSMYENLSRTNSTRTKCEFTYNILGISFHTGGHYFAMIKDNNGVWCIANDETVSDAREYKHNIDLSDESGIVINPNGEYYPKTIFYILVDGSKKSDGSVLTIPNCISK
jgi:hypothetical protein